MIRPPVIDYKLVDVPELGYFLTDKPYPRGELLVKTSTMMPGYYKRPDVTAEVFDADGYYHTGDVMAEIEPDRLGYVDRSKNVLKLSQGEFVAVANLEAVFAGAPLVRQIFVYGNSERPNLLAVIVPTPEALERFGADTERTQGGAERGAARDRAYRRAAVLRGAGRLPDRDRTVQRGQRTAVRSRKDPAPQAQGALRRTARAAATPNWPAARVDELRALRENAANRPVLESVTRAAQAVLGSTDVEVDPDAHFTDLGGDSLSALTFANLLRDIFGVDVPVGVIVGPTSDLRQLAAYIEAERESGSKRPTFARCTGGAPPESGPATSRWTSSSTRPRWPLPRGVAYVTGDPKTVLLTGANGWLGRFLALELLERRRRPVAR